MNLVLSIRAMENKISVENLKHKEKIKQLEEGLKVIRGLNTACEECCGEKQIMRPRMCAEDDREIIDCPECHGSGLAYRGTSKWEQ